MAKPSRRTTTSTSDGESRVVRTSGEIFADGSVIELIATAPGNRLDVLFWNGHQKTIAHQLEHHGRFYLAHDLDETLLRAIHFPTDAKDYGTARQLFGQMRKLFERYVGLSSPESALMTAWSCSTWFQDCVSSPPTPQPFYVAGASRSPQSARGTGLYGPSKRSESRRSAAHEYLRRAKRHPAVPDYGDDALGLLKYIERREATRAER